MSLDLKIETPKNDARGDCWRRILRQAL